jgi:hypothetical protein
VLHCFERKFQAGGIDVDGDDLRRAGHARSHDCCQADCTGAEGSEGGPGMYLHRVQHRTGAGLDAAAEGPEQLELYVLVHLDDI